MSRAEKYLPFVIALVVPMVGLINANLPFEEIEMGRLATNYLQISIILLIIWYYNRWLISKTLSFRKTRRYSVMIAANSGLIITISLLSSIDLSTTLRSDIPVWLIIYRLSLVVLIFNVVLRVFQAQREKSKLEVQNISLQAENLKFQVDLLKQQINPHFLFNSLNTLLDMVEEDDKEKAIQYIRNFSGIYRSLLQSAKYDFIPLEDELKFLKEYWGLLKVRFLDAIDLTIDIGADKMTALIPPLSLQFLVENAVKHNEASIENPLKIEVKESHNTLTIKNKIRLKGSIESEQVGLKNLQQRFSLLYKSMEWRTQGEFFIVQIPLKMEE